MTKASHGFNGERLKELREARRMTGVQLAKRLEVSRQAISQYEKGRSVPSADVLFKMARTLNVPLHFFLTKEVRTIGGPVFFRSMAAATKSARESARRRYGWARDLIDYLSEFVKFPRVSFPALDVPNDPAALADEDIEELAQETRRHWGLGEGPIGNMVWLLENNGAVVVTQDFDVKTLDAFSEWARDGDRPYFVLGKTKGSAARSRLDAAHELGHMILHRRARSLPSSSFRLMEEQAFRFAGAFLLPARTFQADAAPTLRSLVLAKAKWRVSIAAMIKRMRHLDLIPPNREQYLFANLSRRGWRTREPLDDQLEPERPQLIQRALDLLISNGTIRPTDLESRLGLYLQEIEDITGLTGYFHRNEPDPEFPKIIPFDRRD